MDPFHSNRDSQQLSSSGHIEAENHNPHDTYSSAYAQVGIHPTFTKMDSQMPLVKSQLEEEQSYHDVEGNLPLGQAIKKYPKLVGWCVALTLAIIGWGYDLVIVGSITAVDSFQEDYGEEHNGKQIIPASWLSMWLGLPLGGNALGSLFGGWLGDRIGRRLSLMTGSVFSAIAIGFIFFSFTAPDPDIKRAVFTVGLTLQGFSVGIIKTTCLTYVSENAPTAIRTSAMALFPTCTLAGQLIGAVVVFVINGIPGQNGYLGAFGSQWILTLAPFIISIFMPESPAQSVRVGRRDRALKAAERLFAPKVDHHLVLKRIEETIEEEQKLSEGITYYHAFRGIDFRRTLIVILANVLPAMFGLDLLSNVSYFLQTIGLDSSVTLLFQIIGIVCGMLGNAGGLWILTKVGRRRAIMVTVGVAGCFWGGMGISGFWRGDIPGYIAAGFMIGVVITCGLGCWPAGYAIMGETSSLQLRAKTQAVGLLGSQASSVVMSVSLPYVFGTDAANLGGKTGFIYFGLCMVAVILTWLWVPEMKGRSAREIDHMFAIGLPTRKFKRFVVPGHQGETAMPLREQPSV